MGEVINESCLVSPQVWDAKDICPHWALWNWTPSILCQLLGNRSFQVRLTTLDGQLHEEDDSVLVEASASEFTDWFQEAPSNRQDECRLRSYSPKFFSGCINYKYFDQTFQTIPSHFNWRDLGIQANISDSVLWYGSPASSTPLHFDTYGQNFVLQVFGSKTWYLLPPSATPRMSPTRIPFEESSVWGRADPRNDPEVKRIRLEAGQLLFVPPKWWHFVVANEPSISVNVWRPVESDPFERLKEAVGRAVAESLAATSGEVLLARSEREEEEEEGGGGAGLKALEIALSGLVGGDATVSAADVVDAILSPEVVDGIARRLLARGGGGRSEGSK